MNQETYKTQQIIYCVCMCLCMFVFIYVCACVYVYVMYACGHLHVDKGGPLMSWSIDICPIICSSGLSLGMELDWQPASPNSICHSDGHTQVLCGCQGFELRSSVLHSKQCT